MQTHDSRTVPEKATSRRTFLKGMVIATSTPAVAFAPVVVASIAGLIASYADVRAEIVKLCAQTDAIWDQPERPPLATMMRRELGMPYAMNVNHEEIRLRSTLVDLFDYEDRLVDFNKSSYCMPEQHAARVKARTDAARKRVLAIWDERQAAHTAWAKASGYDALNERLDHLYDVETNLDDQIINWRCETLDDVRLKAAHLDRVYEGRMSHETSAAVIKSLIA